jgi:hypothetical protein
MNTPKSKLRVLYQDLPEKWLEVAKATLERDSATVCRECWLRSQAPVTEPLHLRGVFRLH